MNLTIQYAEEDLYGSAPEFLRVAYRGADGRWYGRRPEAVDPLARTVTVSTTHFSDWALYERYSMVPGWKAVVAGYGCSFRILETVADPAGGSGDGEPLNPEPQSMLGSEPAVNGIPGGKDIVGHIVAVPAKMANYTAPNKAPKPSTVAVSASITTEDLAKVTLVSRVTVVPRRWTLTLRYTRVKECGRGALWHFEQKDGFSADFELDEFMRIVGVASPLPYLATTKGGSCYPATVSGEVVPGKPLEFFGLSGSYESGNLTMSYDVRFPDFPGFRAWATHTGDPIGEVAPEEPPRGRSPRFSMPARDGAFVTFEHGDDLRWTEELTLTER